MNSISLKNVRYQVKNKLILKDISIDFSDRCLTGVIGNNGSGKTTLLRLILGTIPLSAGTIQINGKNLSDYKRKELARCIALLSQNTFADFAFPCKEVVLMGRNPYRSRFQTFTNQDYQIVEKMMQSTDTQQFCNSLITELSAGEEQMVFLARALAQTPQFLLLDEPTSHLDVYRQIRILELVKSLSKKIGVVMVIHELNMAARFCDQLLLLHQGEMAAQGTPEEVLTPTLIERVFHVSSAVRYEPALQSIQLTFMNRQDFSSQAVQNLNKEASYV